MNDNSEPPPKVVDFRTRRAHAPELVLPDETKPAPGEPDPAVILALETALAMARQGRLHGLIALAWDPVDKEFWRHLTVPHLGDFQIRGAAAMMLGGLQMLEEDLKDAAFWTQGYDPLCLARDEEGL